MAEVIDTFYYMRQNKVCTKITVCGDRVDFEYYSDFKLDKAFGNVTSATYEDLYNFFEERCFPRERANCKQLLKMLGVDFYEPYEIVKKTHGVLGSDDYWIKFEGETLEYKEARKLVGLDVDNYEQGNNLK